MLMWVECVLFIIVKCPIHDNNLFELQLKPIDILQGETFDKFYM